jgi:hypothetical protein
MLDLVASAQAGHAARLHRIAAALVEPRALESLLAASRMFADALCRLRLHLPGRPAPVGPAASARLH